MTKEEAIKVLKIAIEDSKEQNIFCFSKKGIEALEMAIKALEFDLDKHDEEVIKDTVASIWGKPCEDCVSRTDVYDLVTRLFTSTEMTNEEYKNAMRLVKELPSVKPSDEALKEAYDKGFEYGVKEWFASKTKPYEEIINRIEQVRDNDKNAGEYPYNRCIEVIREVMG